MGKHNVSGPSSFDGMTTDGLAKLAAVLAVATILLTVFSSEALVQWSRDLPSSRFNARLAHWASTWHGLMLAAGPARLVTRIKRALPKSPDRRDAALECRPGTIREL